MGSSFLTLLDIFAVYGVFTFTFTPTIHTSMKLLLNLSLGGLGERGQLLALIVPEAGGLDPPGSGSRSLLTTRGGRFF